MAVKYKRSELTHHYIPDAYAITLSKEGQESTAPSLVTGNQLRDMLNLRVRFLSRDIRNAVQDGGLNEEGYAIDIPLWAECIEDITRAIAFFDSESKFDKEIVIPIQYAGSGCTVWTIARVESAA